MRLSFPQRISVIVVTTMLLMAMFFHNPFSGYQKMREFANGSLINVLSEISEIDKIADQNRKYESQIWEVYEEGFSPNEIYEFLEAYKFTEEQVQAYRELKRRHSENSDIFTQEQLEEFNQMGSKIEGPISFLKLKSTPKSSVLYTRSKQAHFVWIDEPLELGGIAALIILLGAVTLFVFRAHQ